MRNLIVSALVGSIALSGLIGCSGSVDVEKDHHAGAGGDHYYKKTETRDANGNLVEKKVESKSTN